MDYTSIYSGEKTQANLDSLTKATLADFTADLRYAVAERVANVSSSTNNATQTEYFLLRSVVADPNDLVRCSQAFSEHVRAGRAYLVDPTTTTTTAGA